MLARRQIPPHEYSQWRLFFDKAACSLHNRQKLLSDSYDLIEKNLELVGATAVEDKLQDDVAETIAKFRQCDITFYILTGDKRETAVNIGRSCGMIGPQTEVLVSPEDSVQDVVRWLRQK